MSTTSGHTMKYRYLGNSGLLVSRLSFGSWVTFDSSFGVDAAYDIMVQAFNGGINFFDNAEGYAAGKSEEIMGDVVQRGIAHGVWTREDLVLTTKIFVGTKTTTPPPGPNDTGISRKHIIEGTKASLKRMQLDYVDVLYCHRPEEGGTPIEETVRAMNYCIQQGWAFYWGTSEWTSHDIATACAIADRLHLIRPVVEQPQYHIFERSKVEFDYINLYKQYGLGLSTWSPLAFGILSGKYRGGNIPDGSRLTDARIKALVPDLDGRIAKTEQLEAIAQELNCSMAQLAIAWCASNERVSTVILGASSTQQLAENLAANDVVERLTPEIKQRIDAIAQFTPKVVENDHWSLMRNRFL